MGTIPMKCGSNPIFHTQIRESNERFFSKDALENHEVRLGCTKSGQRLVDCLHSIAFTPDKKSRFFVDGKNKRSKRILVL